MFSVHEVRAALGRELLSERPGASRVFSGVANDSRTTTAGQIFVALKTENRDGHAFVPHAVSKGAAAVIIQSTVAVPDGVAVFRVRDTQHALGQMAASWRARWPAKTIAVTGNVGKTTTKELTAAVLAQRYSVLKSAANFNDEVGLSMTLLQLGPRHERAVLEMGMFHIGEIRRLCEIARPEVAAVLNVGPTHLERLGTIEAIARAKAEAVEALPQSGTAILNADDPHVAAMAARTRARVLTFGFGAGAGVRGDDLRSHGLAGVDFTLRAAGRALSAHSPLPGADLVRNALAAAAVALVEGFSLEEAVAALRTARVETRLQVRRTRAGVDILDDCYNASPASMSAALDVLAETPAVRRLALLGDMLELGSEETPGHESVGRRAAAVADVLVTVGRRAAIIGRAASAAGAPCAVHAGSREEAARWLKHELRPGDVLLVKASHGMALETVVAELLS